MMTVGEAAAALAARRGEALVVSTMSGLALGGWDRPDLDLRLTGVMGAASSLGLGLAIGLPDRQVLVVDGDGSLLMQLGCLATIGGAKPANLTHVVLANGTYAVSGAQPVPNDVEWPALALAAGYVSAAWARSVDELDGLVAAAGPGPRLVAVVCDPARPEYPAGAFDFDASVQGPALRAQLG